MSENLFYDRTRNITGLSIIDESAYTPTYGSSVTFMSENMRFDTHDSYYKTIPRGINNLTAKFSLKYKSNENGAANLANYYEASEGDQLVAVITDPSIYQKTSGYCTDYSINHTNNQHYEISPIIEVTEAPSMLNWSGMNFVSPDFTNWQDSQTYKKYDIVYTGVYGQKINNFFYCKEDHSSNAANSPTGENTSWTQEFFWEPDIGLSTQVKLAASRYDGGFSSFYKTKKNTATFPVSYNFSSISTKQLKSMLHFLENKGGYRRFRHQMNSVYNRPKVFICPSWTHTFVYNNSHNLQVNFEEDPLGVIPKKD